MNRNKQQSLREAAQAHRVNIQKSLQHRLEVARAKGDESLIRQLEAEMNYYN
jgi:ribosome-binding protein aMBF1 (putative translation factor)